MGQFNISTGTHAVKGADHSISDDVVMYGPIRGGVIYGQRVFVLFVDTNRQFLQRTPSSLSECTEYDVDCDTNAAADVIENMFAGFKTNRKNVSPQLSQKKMNP